MAWYPAIAQESVSRASSHILSKLDDVESRGDLVRRLQWALSNMEFAIERSGKMPITDVSLLRQRKFIKNLYIEGREILRKHEQQLQLGEVPSSSSLGRIVTRAANSSIFSLLGIDKKGYYLSSSTVKKVEQYAEWADKFLERVETGCSRRPQMISNNPLLRLLFESKTLGCATWKGASLQSILAVWATRSEERGVDATLVYWSHGPKMLEKSFFLALGLRLSESTDIIGTAIRCLQPLVPQFKDAVESAIGQLSQQASNLLELSPSVVDSLVPVKKGFAYVSHGSRMDPICCWSNGHGPSGDNTVSSKLSHICPEEVTFHCFNCYASLELEKRYSLRRSSDAAGRSVMSPLEVYVMFLPHFDGEDRYPQLELLEGSTSIEPGSNDNYRLISIDEVLDTLDTVVSTATQSYLQRPELTEYSINWFSKHGAARFLVTRPTTRRSAKRKR